jgi:hypothetical protein
LATDDRRSAIVTVRSRKHAAVPDMTVEEHKRRGNGADAMLQEFKHLIEAVVAKDRK